MQYKVVLKVRHDLDEVANNIKKLVATADALKNFEKSIEEHQEATKIAKKSAYDQAFRHKKEKHTQSITPLYKTPIAVQNLLGVKTTPGLTSKIIKNGNTLKSDAKKYYNYIERLLFGMAETRAELRYVLNGIQEGKLDNDVIKTYSPSFSKKEEEMRLCKLTFSRLQDMVRDFELA